MKARRVVITGISAITPLGDSWQKFGTALRNNISAIKVMPEWQDIKELNTRLAAPVKGFELPKHYTRKKMRTMGRVSKLAVRATELALENAGLSGYENLGNGRVGISYGSCTGSPDAMEDFVKFISQSDISDVNATTYVRMMSHTAAVNIGIFFGLQGRMITTSTACTSSSQAIGYAYECIQSGKQDMMVAGGAEELCASEAAIFDTLFATSLRNDEPNKTPRPFDRDRDGLVVGEGACTFIIEALDHAERRGAEIIAEIIGFGTNSDGNHITQPTAATMSEVMRLALEDADIEPEQVGYINAHGTATKVGDLVESQATHQVFGKNALISSLKGHIGHTLGACGSIEAWASINMMNEGWFAPTLNLEHVDENLNPLDYIVSSARENKTNIVMSNNFAFGGINTSLIFRRWEEG